jgi:hypothetical protein
MSTTINCDYRDCGQPAAFTVASRPHGLRTFEYPASIDACHEHVELVHVYSSGLVGWALLPVPA